MIARRYRLCVDPGGQHTGIVLLECTAFGLLPVDGLTVDRLPEQRDTVHTGCPRYVRRVNAACVAMLDRHEVADEDFDVFVETLKPTVVYGGWTQRTTTSTDVVVLTHLVKRLIRTIGELRKTIKIMQDTVGANGVLNGVSAAWPDAHLVEPDDHDHAASGYPTVLKGRRPKGWTTGGGTARHHQCAAWAMGIAGMRQLGLDTTVVPDEVEAAVRAVRAGGSKAMGASTLVAAVRRAADPAATPEQIVGWAFMAAKIVRPETPDSLRGRLLAQALAGAEAA